MVRWQWSHVDGRDRGRGVLIHLDMRPEEVMTSVIGVQVLTSSIVEKVKVILGELSSVPVRP